MTPRILHFITRTLIQTDNTKLFFLRLFTPRTETRTRKIFRINFKFLPNNLSIIYPNTIQKPFKNPILFIFPIQNRHFLRRKKAKIKAKTNKISQIQFDLFIFINQSIIQIQFNIKFFFSYQGDLIPLIKLKLI